MTELPVSSPRVTEAVSFLQEVFDEVRDSNVAFMAGSIAYSAFVSLFPLLVLAVILASALGGELFANYVISLTGSYLSPSGQELIVESLARAQRRAELSIVTLAVFLWATLRVFRGLDVAFSILYDTSGVEGLVDQIKDGFVVFVALWVAVAGTVLISLAISALPDAPYARLLDKLLLVVFLTVIFLPVYYVFPDVDLAAREVVPGALVAAVGWTALQATFQFYVALSDKTELYGVVGAVILLVTWLYFGAFLVLLGATVNVVLDRRSTTPLETYSIR